jgi:hypothetical protein
VLRDASASPAALLLNDGVTAAATELRRATCENAGFTFLTS